jgi:hypothetical protein
MICIRAAATTTTTEDFEDCLDTNDAVIIARPCHHTGWVAKTFAATFDIGHALYVGLPKKPP